MSSMSQRKGCKQNIAQPTHHFPALPPVGDPVQHQAFLSIPSKRHFFKRRQQEQQLAASLPEFGRQEGKQDYDASGEQSMQH